MNIMNLPRIVFVTLGCGALFLTLGVNLGNFVIGCLIGGVGYSVLEKKLNEKKRR